MNSTECIEEIIKLNNQGVALLGSGADQQAVSVLTTSLVTLQRLIGIYRPDETSPDDNLSVATPACSPLKNLRGSSYFIYNRPLSLEAKAKTNSDLQLYSACTILNLAMTYHRQSKITCNNICMRKAEAMYEMIITLLNTRFDDTSLFLRMIAVNNLSEILYEQGKYDQYREELQWLSSAIRQGGSKLKFFQQDDLNLLLLNVLVLLTPPQAASAA